MSRLKAILIVVGLGLLIALILAACGAPATTQAPAATQAPTSAPAATSAPATTTPTATEAPAATEAPVETALPTATSPAVIVTPTAGLPTLAVPTTTAVVTIEHRVVELKWPPSLKLGDSDLIRISLVPSKDGYIVTTEFPEHQVATQEVPVPRPGGYDLSGVARLDGVGFAIEPNGDQVQGLPLAERVTWRWTITPRAAGQQRLSLNLRLRWTPSADNKTGVMHETTFYDKGLNVTVLSFFGLTTNMAMMLGFMGLMVGGGLGLPLAATLVIRPQRRQLSAFAPNQALVVEKHPAFELDPNDLALLKVLFRRYARLTLEAEFRSGYSGARTFLALPVRADGRADAYTIAKLGDRDAIQREYENYERFVKDTLPPITARIQEPPVVMGAASGNSTRAALRYTFIGEAGKTPVSLREALLAQADPALLTKLFDTFGPNWWMQRKPYTFRLAQDYDRLLPAHYVLQPATVNGNQAAVLDGRAEPSAYHFNEGDLVTVRNLQVVERRADGKSLSLVGEVVPGHPPLRLRWLSLTPPKNGTVAQVVATRETLLRKLVMGLELYGLPDPLLKLPALLNERVMGTQSTIHGDLNVENVLVGPGGLLWLIDFAQTHDGHTLYDFAHLEAEIIAHVIAPALTDPRQIVSPVPLVQPESPPQPLLSALHAIAMRCLFNPNAAREYQLALCLACLGALKFTNLNPHQKQVLYLVAAQLTQTL